jgi:HEAT repeat protein
MLALITFTMIQCSSFCSVIDESQQEAAQAEQKQIVALIEKLKNPDGQIREAAACELQEFGPRAKLAVSALIRLVENGGGEGESAAYALGAIGPSAREAIPTLTRALRNENDFLLRAGAAQALGCIGSKGTGNVGRKSPETIELLGGLLADGHFWVRFKAIQALGKIGPPAIAAKRQLQDKIEDENDRVIGVMAAHALMRIDPDNKDAVRCLIAAIDVSNDGIQIAGSLPPSNLEEAIRRSTRLRREWAVKNLGELGISATEAVPALTGCLKDDDPNIRDRAKEALNLIAEGRK